MKALLAQMKFRIFASFVLAVVGNSSAATSNIDSNVARFKAVSAVLRPQTTNKKAGKVSPNLGDDDGVIQTTVIRAVPINQVQPSPLIPPSAATPVGNSPGASTAPTDPMFQLPKVNAPTAGFSPDMNFSQDSSAFSSPPLPPSRPEISSIAEPDRQTHAGAVIPGCPDGKCAQGPHQSSIAPIPGRVAGLNKSDKYHSPQEECYSSALLEAAKRNVKSRYHNRPKSGGYCAFGVRTSINKAGISSGSFGNAVDYEARGRAAAIGMKNYISEYGDNMSKIPPGAILVFAGPKSSTYLKTGYEGRKGGKGTYLGHVTIKGDDGKYYTDGRTEHPATGWPDDKKTRKLVGVYLMQKCTASCSPALRQRCGG